MCACAVQTGAGGTRWQRGRAPAQCSGITGISTGGAGVLQHTLERRVAEGLANTARNARAVEQLSSACVRDPSVGGAVGRYLV